MTVMKTKTGLVVANKMKNATKTADRMIGLMFSKKMDGYDALLIRPCNSIHTFFMNYPIDVIFMDKEFKIVKIIRNIKPWRMTRIYFKAVQVLELMGGSLSEAVKEGDQLESLDV